MEKKNIVEELEKQEYFAKILKYEKIKVLFCGCVDKKDKVTTKISDIKKNICKSL